MGINNIIKWNLMVAGLLVVAGVAPAVEAPVKVASNTARTVMRTLKES